MEVMPSLNMPVQRLKVAILPLDLPCSGPVTHSGEILTTGKSDGKKSDRVSYRNVIHIFVTVGEEGQTFHFSLWSAVGSCGNK